MKKCLLALCLLLPTVLAPAQAMARVTETSAVDPDRSESSADGQQAEDRRLIEAFGTALVSLTGAMSTAEMLHDGSRTVQISFDSSGVGGYRVRTVKGEQVWENIIDANTGKQAGEEKSLLLDELSDEDRNKIAVFKFVRQQLADAVAVAEKATSGKAIGGGLMQDRRKLNFVVIIVSEDQLKQVMLEPPHVVRWRKETRRPPSLGIAAKRGHLR